MSDLLPAIKVPVATSRFNVPAGEGLVKWLAEMGASTSVGLVEVQGAAARDATAKDAAVTRAATIKAEEVARRAAELSDEALAASKQYTDDTLSTSHLDLDTDGTPYFRQGSMTLSIHADTDGNPFFLDN